MKLASPDSGPPPLVSVKKRFTGETIERALEKFEDQCSEEDVDTLVIQERTRHGDSVLVQYEVRWRYSVFDDHACGSYVAWALLAPADTGAGDPSDARFRVVEATADHHNL